MTFLKGILTLFFVVTSVVTNAHEVLERQCINKRVIDQEVSFEEAFILMERLQFIGNSSEFTKKDWKVFVDTLKTYKVKSSDLMITVESQCDFHSLEGAADKNISKYSGEGYNSFVVSISGNSSLPVKDSGMDAGKIHHRVYAERFIQLKGLVITRKSCTNPLTCGPEVLAFYIKALNVSIINIHATGGLSTAGGGKAEQLPNPTDELLDYSKVKVVIPGFEDLMRQNFGKIPYRDQMIGAPLFIPTNKN